MAGVKRCLMASSMLRSAAEELSVVMRSGLGRFAMLGSAMHDLGDLLNVMNVGYIVDSSKTRIQPQMVN